MCVWVVVVVVVGEFPFVPLWRHMLSLTCAGGTAMFEHRVLGRGGCLRGTCFFTVAFVVVAVSRVSISCSTARADCASPLHSETSKPSCPEVQRM